MSYPTDSTAFQIEDYLLALVNAQTGVGGTMAGVVTVQRAVPPDTDQFPAVGIAFQSFSGDVVGTGPTYQRDATFLLTASVKQPFNPSAPDTTEAARIAVRQYVDNGSGLGLIPLLKSNYSLGGLAQASWITALEIVPYGSKSATAGTIAMAVISFRTRYRTR